MDSAQTTATESHIECPIITVPEDADDAMIQALERGATLADFAFITLESDRREAGERNG